MLLDILAHQAHLSCDFLDLRKHVHLLFLMVTVQASTQGIEIGDEIGEIGFWDFGGQVPVAVERADEGIVDFSHHGRNSCELIMFFTVILWSTLIPAFSANRKGLTLSSGTLVLVSTSMGQIPTRIFGPY